MDDEEDKKHIALLEKRCSSVRWAFCSPAVQKLVSLRGLLNGTSLTENAYPSKKLRKQLRAILANNDIDLIFLYSAAAWTFLPIGKGLPPVVTDLVDVDSAKWGAYARERSFPMSYIYAREADKLKSFEIQAAHKSCATILVSQDEADFFIETTANPNQGDSIEGIANGVDITVFSPERYMEEPGKSHRLIFTGAMDYAPNVQAVVWFADHVLPKLMELRPEIEFVIAGRPVAPSVSKLAERPGVQVLGGVDDMACEIARAAIVVAPLQTARGIQNKVLEGMAMAKPVVASSLANEGINAADGVAIHVADTPEETIQATLNLLAKPDVAHEIGNAARSFVAENFSWQAAYEKLDRIISKCLEEGT